MTKKETIAALMLIATFFPHTFEVSDTAMVDLWHRELEAFNAPDVEAAVRDLCRTKEKFPSLKDVLDRLGANRSATDAWREACRYASDWGLGDKAVRVMLVADPDGDKLDALGQRVRVQEVQNPGLTDPMLKAAVEAVGGIQAIRARTLDDEPAMRAHFFRAFEEATRTMPARTFEKLGPGHLANAIAAIGRPVPLPPQRALEWEDGSR